MENQSLAAATGTLMKPQFEVPAVFQEPSDKIVGRFSSPYIVFAHKNRADEYKKLVGQFGSVEEGEMFLIEGGEMTKLDTAKLGLLKAKQFWAEKNAAGEVLRTSFTEMPHPWTENIEAVVLVYFDDRITVANVQPRTTKCSGFKTLADALEECQKADWGARSPAHMETMQINQPFMRFFGELSLSAPRISKKTGLPYKTTQCTVKPVTNVEAKLLKAFAESEDATKLMNDAAQRFTFQVQDIESKLIKK